MKLWVGDERLDRGRRGQRSRQRARPRAARRCSWARTRARPHPPHRLQGAGPRHRGRHRRRGPRAHRLDRRRRCVDHDRRVHQHHRGVVAGAHRRPRLRPPPHRTNRFSAMAAPDYVPVDRTQPVRGYASPPRRPESWRADRPGEVIDGGQPRGRPARQPGPRPGLLLTLARRFEGKLTPRPPASTRRTRWPGAVARRPEAGVAVRPGAGDPRPHRRLHASGGSSTTRRRRAGRAAHARSSRRCRTRTTTGAARGIVDLVPDDVAAADPGAGRRGAPRDWRVAARRPGHAATP